jgi:hypothetical protein
MKNQPRRENATPDLKKEQKASSESPLYRMQRTVYAAADAERWSHQ